MPLINGAPINTRVFYNGTEIPPKPALAPIPEVPTVINYNGQTLSKIPAQNVPSLQDLTNNPSLVVIGGVTLTANVVIPVKDEKELAQDQIIDGVSVFEHISRKPAEIDFDFTLFPVGVIPGNTKPVYNNVSPFPQPQLNLIWSKIWLLNTVQKIQNTYINSLQISEVIIKSISATPIKGTANISVKLKALENQPGQSIIMSS